MKMFKKFVSVLLSVLMVTSVIPMSVYANETEEANAVSVTEIEESRDLYSKTYETSENTNVVISSAVPLHYEENGELKEINNTLVNSDEDSSILTNTANAYSVELPKKYTNDSEIEIDYSGSSITFKLIDDVSSSKGNIDEPEEINTDITDAESVAYAESNIENLSSSITYENLLPDTDIEYTVSTDTLKENIIINDLPEENYAIKYELNTGELTAVLNDDNSISLYDDEKENVFVIEAPYMFDYNENISCEIAVTLSESENGYILTYTPDYSWLSDESTEFPVTIDPTVTVVSNKTTQSIEDTFVTTSTKTKNKSTMTTVAVQTSSSQSWAYYNINTLPELPDNAKVTNFTLNLFTTTDVSTPYNLAMYALAEDAEIDDSYISDVTWNNKTDPSDTVIDLEVTPENPGLLTFDITNLANKWYQDTDLNRILVIKALDGTLKTTIASSEYISNTDKLPYISLEYTTVDGLGSDLQYHSQDIDLAGTAYINDYTGSLTVERTELTSNGSAGDITVYMGDGVNVPENNCYGDNMSVNYYQTLTIDSLNDDSEYIITYGEGSKDFISDGDEYSIDDSTEGIIIVSYAEGDNYISKTFSSLVFSDNEEKESDDKIYALTEISTIKNYENAENAESSIVAVEYDNNRIYQITDELGVIEFEYSNGILYGIDYTLNINYSDSENIIAEDCAGVAEVYSSYDYKDDLIITLNNNDSIFPEQQISYTFSDDGNITKITNETGLSYVYTYNDSNQVVKVQEYASDNTAGEYLTFDYGTDSTIVSDGTSTYTEYFDLSGKLLSIVDQDGNAVFAQYSDGLISKISQTRNSARNIVDFYGFESNNDSFFNTTSGYVNVSNDKKLNGNSSVELTTPAGISAAYSNKISGLDADSTYTVSMWLYNENSADCSLTLTNGDTNGIFTTVNSQDYDGWQQFYCTIDTEDSTYLNITISVDNSTNTDDTVVYIDNMYVQKSPYLTNVNLLENGDFSDSLSGWSDTENTVITEDSDISTQDSYRLKLVGDYTSENTISQTVSINASEGTKYTYGGWIKAVDALPEKDGTDRELSLSVYAVSADGETEELLSSISYSTYYSDWQYLEDEITLPSDFGDDDDTYSALKFVISYNYQMGYALVDGVSLSKDELYTVEFEYDENGAITAITANETTVSLTDGEENEDDDSTYSETYEYDDYGNVSKITQTATVDDISENIVSKFEYSTEGSLLMGELGEFGRWTTYKYDFLGNIATVTDANGNSVEYEYDNFENLSAIINEFESNYIHYNNREDGSETAETYTLKVQYTYTGNRLDKIETGNVEDDEFTVNNTYDLIYDEWNNMTDIYINDEDHTEAYIHYEYDETNYRRLNSVSYINGQEIHYVYDDTGNIIYEYDTSDTDGETLSYSYYYYDNGTCYGKKNLISGTIESYQDDLTTVKDSDGNIIHVYGYDEDGNLLEQIGDNYVEVAQTDSNSSSEISTTVNDNESIVSAEYDDFGRVSSETLRGDGDSYILRKYTYYDNLEDSTQVNAVSEMFYGREAAEADEDADSTNYVRYLTYYTVDSDGTETFLKEYRYLYYANGDIGFCTVANEEEKSLDSIIALYSFAYNSDNMLTADFSTLYTYDSQGNIISKIENGDDPSYATELSYDSDSGTALKNCLTNITKTYADSEECLDIDVSYDEYGNVSKLTTDSLNLSSESDEIQLKITGLDLDWARGSTLTGITAKAETSLNSLPLFSLSSSLDIISYEYDDNNIRTDKSINLSLDELSDLTTLLGIDDSECTLAKADISYTWRDNLLVGVDIDCEGSIFDEEISGDTVNEGGKYSVVILYDQNDSAYGIVVNKTEDSEGNSVNESNIFYYLKDASNTIRAIIDEDGNELVNYEYNPYGAVTDLSNALGYRYLMFINPLAYRDYNYDIESGMYYLQSRYYNPFVARFISPDSVLNTGSGTAMCTNLYSYCENDPVNNSDPYGYAKINIKWIDVTIDLLIIVIPCVGEINSALAKAGKPSSKIISKATSIFTKYSSKISGFINSALKKVCSKSLAASISSTVVKGILKAMTMFTIFSSIGNFIEYIIDCLDNSWDGYLNTSKKLGIHIVTKKGY